jgi:uncharacterized RDD family membrane protein YckC
MPYRAGFWIRVLATIIDLIAMMMVAAGVGFALTLAMRGSSLSIAPGGVAAMFYLICLIYVSFEIWTAATPGKLLLRLRITNSDCSPADSWRLFLRCSTKWSWLGLNFMFLVTEWSPLYVLAGFLSLIVFIGCFFASNDDHLAWHDQWAQTAVCHRPRVYRSFDAIVPPPLPPPS